ncbi:MAG: hypothetical protein JWQ23_2402 [Herminiimonas sp.]|nr:hypothetical protein [Herminiimonas sp.]
MGAVNSIVRRDLVPTVDSGDPGAIILAAQYAQTDQMQLALKNYVSSLNYLLDRASLLSNLPGRLSSRLQDINVPVTAAAMKQIFDNGGQLDALFAADGPNLGMNLAEARQLLGDMTLAGIGIDATIQYPVIKETTDDNGVTSVLVWMSPAERSALDSYPLSTEPGYPGSTRRTDPEAATRTTYSPFDNFANIKVSNTILANAATAVRGQAVQNSSALMAAVAETRSAMVVIDFLVRSIREGGAKGKEEEDKSAARGREVGKIEEALRLDRIGASLPQTEKHPADAIPATGVANASNAYANRKGN